MAQFGVARAAFETREAVRTAGGGIGATVKLIHCRDRTVAGDKGGGEWKRVAADPGHALINFRSVDRFLPDGTVDAANGGWWAHMPSIAGVRMEHFGGIADDNDANATTNTTALQALFDYMAAGGVNFYAGDSGQEFRLDNQGAVLGSIAADTTGFKIYGFGTFKKKNGAAVGEPAGNDIWRLLRCSRFEIGGRVTLDGNRATRAPVDSTGHNLQMYGGSEFKLSGVRSINSVVDGFLLAAWNAADNSTFVRNGVLEDCKADNCFRNGLSLIDFIDIEIRGGDYSNSNGTNPQTGIDVEPDPGAAQSSNIRINGVNCSSNAGFGIILSPISGANRGIVSECHITNCGVGGIYSGMDNSIITDNIIDSVLTTGDGIALAGLSASDVRCTNNRIKGGAIGINASTPRAVIANNNISDTSGKGILTDFSSSYSRIEGNFITNAVTHGILTQGQNVKIRDNIVVTVAAPVAYISVQGALSSVLDNWCEGADATAIGVHMISTVSRCVGNTCVGLHATDPYTFTAGFAAVLFGCNDGGSANSRLLMRNPASPSL